MAGVNKNFVVKNGLEVDTNLILADADNNRVGINTDNMKYALHVNGGIGATTLYVTGISTFKSIHLDGTVTAGNAGTGSTGQYLVRVGTGVTWQDLPATRSSQTFTATAGQTVFLFSYTVGQLDVFINGVKLSSSEYTANDTASVILNTACFGDETVELISYSSVNPGYGFTGIYGISLFEEGSPVGTTGQVVALNFVGAAVTSTATGIAATVYLTENWEKNSQGVYSLNSVGVGTTNPRFALEVGAVGASGTSLWVNGNARVTGILTVGSSSIVLDGSNNTINVGSGITINGNTGIVSASNFYASGIQVGVITASTIIYEGGVTLTQDWTKTSTGIHTLGNVGVGTTNPTAAVTSENTTVLAAGIVTAYKFYGDGSALTGISGGGTSSQWVTTAAGIHTLSSVGIGTTNPTSALTVKGNTSLETLNVSGVSTFSYIQNTGITSTKDLIVYGTGNGSGSISSMALMSRTNYLDFGPAIPNTTAPQEFAIRMGSDRATGTYGPYKILEGVYYGFGNTGAVFLRNWNGNEAVTIVDEGIFAKQQVIIGAAATTGTASQTLQVTGGAYVSDNVGLGTTIPTSKLHVVGNTLITGVTTTATLNVGTAGTVITTTSAGSVGIGTAIFNPTYKLVVKGDTYLQGNTTSAGFLRIADSTGAYGGTISGSFTTPLSFTHYSDNPEIRFQTQVPLAGSSTRLTINQTSATFNCQVITGNGTDITCGGSVSVASTFTVGAGGTVITTTSAGLVGINSTTPTQKLDVVGSVKVGINTSQGVILTSPNGTKYQLFVENDGTLKTVAV